MIPHSPEDCSIRDALSVERTRLANERTFLAYVRTSLTLWAGTATLIHFFANYPWSATLAACLLAAGGATLGAGVYRFFKTEARLKRRAPQAPGAE